MEFVVGVEEGVVVLDLTGNLIASTGDELVEHVEKSIGEGRVHIALDMEKIRFMDSSGLKACFVINKMLSERNGMLVLLQPNETVAKVLHITGAEKKFSIAGSRHEGFEIMRAGMGK